MTRRAVLAVAGVVAAVAVARPLAVEAVTPADRIAQRARRITHDAMRLTSEAQAVHAEAMAILGRA